MANDRSLRFLTVLGAASTSRVLNLPHIAATNRSNSDYFRRPLFVSPVINRAFILKHKLRSNDAYRFETTRTMATKLIAPVDPANLEFGGQSVMIEQRGFHDALRTLGVQGANLDRDLEILMLLNALPSLDPFLLREHLSNHKIDVAPCYFPISAMDQADMHKFVTSELTRLTALLRGTGSADSTQRMVSAMLSSDVAEELAPLRETLNLTGNDFRNGVFSWRGFLYYKWSMDNYAPRIMGVLREVAQLQPVGPLASDQKDYLSVARRLTIELVRDHANSVERALSIYDSSFADLVGRQAPKMFRTFLMDAPRMFLELGEKMGAITHIIDFWRYRFPTGQQMAIDAEALITIFQDFTTGLDERMKVSASPMKRPAVIDGRNLGLAG
jgi:hypothetical protein